MSDKLFFGEVEREGNAAKEAYMKSRGSHTKKEDLKEIKVEGNPGSDLGKGE